jgi:Mg2+/Co2+ transporter CorB
MSGPWVPALLVALVALSAFFSGSEIALLSASRPKLATMAAGGRRDAQRALRLLADTPGNIAMLLVGNNLVNTALSSLATALAVAWAPGHGVAVATAAVAPVLLLAGEILPKSLGRTRPTAWLRRASAPLALARILLQPGVVATSLAVRGLFALLPVPAAERRPLFRRDDLENLFLYGTARGESGKPVQPRWFRMAGRALELGRRRTAEAMVALSAERTCPAGGRVGAALARFRAGGMRYLAAVDERGDVQGIVAAKSLLGADESAPIAPFVRPAYVLDPEQPLDEAIQGFRRHQQSIAVVRDRQGRSLGIVTTEDVLEEIVGEIPRVGRGPGLSPA